MINVDKTELLFEAYQSKYTQVKSDIESMVIEWQWATSSYYDPLPLYNERSGFANGRKMKNEPDQKCYRVQYGFNCDKEIVIERTYNEFDDYSEVFYLREPKSIITVSYDDCSFSKSLVNVRKTYFEDGKELFTESVATQGSLYEEYVWNDDQITEVALYHADKNDGVIGEFRHHYTAHITHADSSKLGKIALHWPTNDPEGNPLSPSVVYERAGKKIHRSYP